MEIEKKTESNSKEDKCNITQTKMITDKIEEQKKKKKSIFKFLLISLITIVVLACAVIVFILIKNNKKRKNEEENESNEINESKNINISENEIYAIYEVKIGEKMSFFNLNDKIDLKEDDIHIKEKSFTSNNLRNLDNLEINNIFYTPSYNGLLSIEIKFKKTINNLENFFLNNKELISVDMGNFEMKEITSMKSTFSGCTNLQEVNFKGKK